MNQFFQRQPTQGHRQESLSSSQYTNPPVQYEEDEEEEIQFDDDESSNSSIFTDYTTLADSTASSSANEIALWLSRLSLGKNRQSQKKESQVRLEAITDEESDYSSSSGSDDDDSLDSEEIRQEVGFWMSRLGLDKSAVALPPTEDSEVSYEESDGSEGEDDDGNYQVALGNHETEEPFIVDKNRARHNGERSQQEKYRVEQPDSPTAPDSTLQMTSPEYPEGEGDGDFSSEEGLEEDESEDEESEEEEEEGEVEHHLSQPSTAAVQNRMILPYPGEVQKQDVGRDFVPRSPEEQAVHYPPLTIQRATPSADAKKKRRDVRSEERLPTNSMRADVLGTEELLRAAGFKEPKQNKSQSTKASRPVPVQERVIPPYPEEDSDEKAVEEESAKVEVAVQRPERNASRNKSQELFQPQQSLRANSVRDNVLRTEQMLQSMGQNLSQRKESGRPAPAQERVIPSSPEEVTEDEAVKVDAVVQRPQGAKSRRSGKELFQPQQSLPKTSARDNVLRTEQMLQSMGFKVPKVDRSEPKGAGRPASERVIPPPPKDGREEEPFEVELSVQGPKRTTSRTKSQELYRPQQSLPASSARENVLRTEQMLQALGFQEPKSDRSQRKEAGRSARVAERVVTPAPEEAIKDEVAIHRPERARTQRKSQEMAQPQQRLSTGSAKDNVLRTEQMLEAMGFKEPKVDRSQRKARRAAPEHVTAPFPAEANEEEIIEVEKAVQRPEHTTARKKGQESVRLQQSLPANRGNGDALPTRKAKGYIQPSEEKSQLSEPEGSVDEGSSSGSEDSDDSSNESGDDSDDDSSGVSSDLSDDGMGEGDMMEDQGNEEGGNEEGDELSEDRRVPTFGEGQRGEDYFKVDMSQHFEFIQDTELKRQATKLHKRLNIDPWDETTVLKEDYVKDVVQENPKTCQVQYFYNHFNERLFPLNMLCALNPSVGTVQATYDAFPPAADQCDPWIGSPLHYACAYKASIDVVGFLLTMKPSMLTKVNDLERTPLHLACVFKASMPVVQLLIKKKPIVLTLKDRNGCTPLHLAAENGAPTGVVNILVRADKSCCMSRTNSNMTPLHLACARSPARAVVKTLIDADAAAIEAVDDLGRTALHVAAQYGAPLAIIQMLVKSCPRLVDAKTDRGEKALDLAKKHQALPDVTSFLSSKM